MDIHRETVEPLHIYVKILFSIIFIKLCNLISAKCIWCVIQKYTWNLSWKMQCTRVLHKMTFHILYIHHTNFIVHTKYIVHMWQIRCTCAIQMTFYKCHTKYVAQVVYHLIALYMCPTKYIVHVSYTGHCTCDIQSTLHMCHTKYIVHVTYKIHCTRVIQST